jgi:Fic family protein
MPILFERPTYEWVARVNQKHKQLAELRLSVEERQALERWTEVEFVYSTLMLEGLDINRDMVARIAARIDWSQAAPDDSEEGKSASALFESLHTVTSIAREQGKDSVLSVELLERLNSPLGAERLRSGGSTSKIAAEPLPVVLESACQWFSADSFAELHPIEQASIVFLRLIELRPFYERNQQTALVAASLFTLRSGLPPIIIEPESQPAYRAALSEGLRMNTKPMVELVAQTAERSLVRMNEAIKGKSRKR